MEIFEMTDQEVLHVLSRSLLSTESSEIGQLLLGSDLLCDF